MTDQFDRRLDEIDGELYLAAQRETETVAQLPALAARDALVDVPDPSLTERFPIMRSRQTGSV
jgi:hypothetical protein